MKLSKLLFAVLGCFGLYSANAADITIFYSPTCPHCHHARDFIENTLIYEYNDLKVLTVNVMEMDNRQAFVDALYKCEYKSGGVPVLVIGEKCFQGYSDKMQSDLRAAEKKSAATNRAEMEKDKEAFVKSHSDRKNAVSEKDIKKKITDKSGETSNIILYVLLGLLLGGLGAILFKKQK